MLKLKELGTDIIVIEGVKKLKDVSYTVMPDRIETGTFLCMAAMAGGSILVKGINCNHITPVYYKLEEAGCKFNLQKNEIEMQSPKRLKAVDIKTLPYPGFPTDMQSIFTTVLTTAKGTSMIIENLFENRYKYTQELVRMGAKITIEGKTAVVKGVRKLYGAKVKATDLRGGAALVIAGIVAKGNTKVENVEYILRGYDKFDEKLRSLGVDIQYNKG